MPTQIPFRRFDDQDPQNAIYNPLFSSQMEDEGGDEYRKMLISQLKAPAPQAADESDDNAQLVAALGSAANALGTVGGKTADSSGLQNWADLMTKRAAQKQDLAQQANLRREGLLTQLAMLKDKQTGSQKLKESDQAFQERLAGLKADKDKELQKQKTADELKIAQVKGTQEKPLNESQTRYAYNAGRAKSALGELEELETSGYDPASYGASFRKTNIPFFGQPAATSEDRRYQKAGRAFIASVLRPESGGAITDDEWRDYGPIYLPAPGDDAATVASKKATRKQALDSIIAGAGPAFDISKVKTWRDYENEDNALASKKQGPMPEGLQAAERPLKSSAKKPIDQMTDEEVAEELARLKGGK